MKREPSIHISESDFKLVLQEVFEDHDYVIVGTDNDPVSIDEFTQVFAYRAKTKSLSSRLIVVSTDKLLKKTEKVQLARRDNASLFSQQLTLIRRKLKHRGIGLVKPGEKQWLEIKEICELATEFCLEFQLRLEEGYRIYCEMGLKLMKTYSIQRFKQLHATIFSRYECLTEIESDKFPDTTDLIYKYYLKKIHSRMGWTADNFKEDPTKYVYFVRVRKEAEKIGVKASTWIDAQFAGLEWVEAIPDPTQMVGTKATERLVKYCYQNEITVKPKTGPKIDFSKIKKNGKKNPDNTR